MENVLIQFRKVNSNAVIIVKSTVPVGFTLSAINKYGGDILFSPEFLREGQALYDNLYPSRIIVGCLENNEKSLYSAKIFANFLKKEH